MLFSLIASERSTASRLNKHPALQKTMGMLALAGLVLAVYWLWARPYQLHWGATEDEIKRPMPGDELDPHPTFLATRAITIEGTPQEIWPWLVQIGYGRAGFYGYDILENLGSPRGIRSADRIVPELQNVKVGDPVPISAVARTVFYAIERDRYLIWSEGAGQGGFTWALYPVDEHRTRLVSRIRWSHHWRQPNLLVLDLFTDLTDHLAVRKVLQGVRDRAEGHIESLGQGTTEFALYFLSALIFVGAVVLLLLRPLTWRRWLAGLAAGAGWLVTWYAPVAPWIGVLLELLVLWGLRKAFRRSTGQPRESVRENLAG